MRFFRTLNLFVFAVLFSNFACSAVRGGDGLRGELEVCEEVEGKFDFPRNTALAMLMGVTHLNLGESKSAINDYLRFLASLELDQIDLDDCESITDEVFVFLAQWLPSLDSLHLCGCKKITDSGFETILGCFKKLQVLDLRKCTGLSREFQKGFYGSKIVALRKRFLAN